VIDSLLAGDDDDDEGSPDHRDGPDGARR